MAVDDDVAGGTVEHAGGPVCFTAPMLSRRLKVVAFVFAPLILGCIAYVTLQSVLAAIAAAAGYLAANVALFARTGKARTITLHAEHATFPGFFRPGLLRYAEFEAVATRTQWGQRFIFVAGAGRTFAYSADLLQPRSHALRSAPQVEPVPAQRTVGRVPDALEHAAAALDRPHRCSVVHRAHREHPVRTPLGVRL
jgi:hypothetical protein